MDTTANTFVSLGLAVGLVLSWIRSEANARLEAWVQTVESNRFGRFGHSNGCWVGVVSMACTDLHSHAFGGFGLKMEKAREENHVVRLGQEESLPVFFIQAEDGIWRILNF
jgi:hypothetical protein